METATAWHRVLNDPELRDLPYKVEANEYGQIVLSPHESRHGLLQSRISELLRDHAASPGARAVEFAVSTRKGVKVPDVVWISEGRLAEIPDDAEASPVMPEIAEKRRLYLGEGAQEVWTCTPDSTVPCHDADGPREASALAPSFSTTIHSVDTQKNLSNESFRAERRRQSQIASVEESLRRSAEATFRPTYPRISVPAGPREIPGPTEMLW